MRSKLHDSKQLSQTCSNILGCSADQAVMMIREPDNAYDSDAMAVQTLSGQALGYVPKEHTARFSHDTTFGHVYSMGRASSVGLWGATVRPSLNVNVEHAFWGLDIQHCWSICCCTKHTWATCHKAVLGRPILLHHTHQSNLRRLCSSA